MRWLLLREASSQLTSIFNFGFGFSFHFFLHFLRILSCLSIFKAISEFACDFFSISSLLNGKAKTYQQSKTNTYIWSDDSVTWLLRAIGVAVAFIMHMADLAIWVKNVNIATAIIDTFYLKVYIRCVQISKIIRIIFALSYYTSKKFPE